MIEKREMSIFQQQFKQGSDQELDLDLEIQNLYRILFEIDKAGESRMTTQIKRYIEKSSDGSRDIKATRVSFLKELVYQAYIDFLKLQEKRTAFDETEKSPEKRTYFLFLYNDCNKHSVK